MDRNDRKETITAMHRRAIIDTAQALFSEKGVDGTTMDEIAKSAQYSKRTVYSYFSSKQALQNAMVQDGIEELGAQLRESVNAETVFLEKYRAFCRTMLHYYQEHTQLALTILDYQNGLEKSPDDPDAAVSAILKAQSEIYRLLEQILTEGQRQRATRQGLDIPKTSVLLWRWMSSMVIFAGRREGYIKETMQSTDIDILQEGFATLLYTIQARYNPFKPL